MSLPTPTPKQIAFLKFLGIRLPHAASRATASEMIDRAVNDDRYAEKRIEWNHAKIFFHPQLYAAERLDYKAHSHWRMWEEYKFLRGDRVVPKITQRELEKILCALDAEDSDWMFSRQDSGDLFYDVVLPRIRDQKPSSFFRKKVAVPRVPRAGKGCVYRAAQAIGLLFLIICARDFFKNTNEKIETSNFSSPANVASKPFPASRAQLAPNAPAIAKVAMPPVLIANLNQSMIGKKIIVAELNGEAHEGTITRLEPDGVTLQNDTGISKIPFAKLSKSECEQFAIDAVK